MLRYAKINGNTYRLESNYRIQDQAGATSVSTVSMALGGNPIPEPSDEVTLYDADDNIEFIGVCGIPETITSSTGFEPDNVTIQVQSLNAILRRRTVNEAWNNKTITEIVQDIFDNYISQEGFTLGILSTITTTFTVYTAGRLFIGDVLDELAAKAGATWNVDSKTKVFSFVVRNSLTMVPAKSRITNVKRTESSRDLRTRQIITGGKGQTSTLVQAVSWAASQTSFATDYPVATASAATINGSPVGIGVSGFDDADTSKTFLWSYNSNTVRVNGNATTKPATGNTVSFTYIGMYDIEINADNDALIGDIATRTGSSGIIENVLYDESIVTAEDGEASATPLLGKFGESNLSVSLECDNGDNTDPLTVWDFNLPALHIVGQFVITSRVRQRLTVDKEYFLLQLSDRDYYTKYGSVFQGYDKSITRLSVRKDVIIVSSLFQTEIIGVTDILTLLDCDILQFPGSEPGPGLDNFMPGAT